MNVIERRFAASSDKGNKGRNSMYKSDRSPFAKESLVSRTVASLLTAGLLIAASSGLSVDAKASRSTLMFDAPDKDGAKFMGEAPQASKDKVPCMVWVDKKPRISMLLIHGFGLHKGAYEDFARTMAADGVAVYAIDVRGFGSWIKKGQNRIDFKATIDDIGLSLQEIKKIHPELPIIVLGESMGGAIALKAAATYPSLVDGVISSVPAGDRYDSANSEIGVVKHILFHGFNDPMNVGDGIVNSATKKEDLRKAWLDDPLARSEITPNELITFQKFMNKSFDVAARIKKAPVLVIQGTKDKLVRPAGTWKLYHSIASPNRQIVLSKTAEHLIFEKNQFSDEDIGFVKNWISRNVASLPSTATQAKTKDEGAQKNKTNQKNNEKGKDKNWRLASGNKKDEQKPDTKDEAGKTKVASAGSAGSSGSAISRAAISYWIELKRDGKVFRCNNKTSFKSGDAIRFHITPESDGYAYIVLKQGTTGNSAVLFPSIETGKDNYLRRGQDYPLPYQDWLAFDSNPGLEKVRILFSYRPIALEKMKKQAEQEKRIAYVSADRSGAKDLIGTRMKLSWDDPNPVIMPSDIAAGTRLATHSKVRLVFDETGEAFAVDVALLHK